ncbi:MAG: Asp-tRNA(Asn)/Glu-tRNA(Gln) amidotransferase subunit GatB [Bacilli bacterium]|jgi:aspartyl-tRNA(Asn)/glutamyl-tRNA(Gln) amidotransferase subunit B|nr:Asp-tRNA(Asn)/Glu-tRNA(Gln) amidotransferase subunit GatB [Bacilli bacterium]
MKKQIAVIGLEMHCELISNSKVFSSAKNEYNETPNSNIVPLDLALPGTLPVVNKKCVGDALKMSMILNCKMPEYMYFDRKNYYYPDLPKGYQITQMTEPVGIDGEIEIEVDEKLIPVKIHDIHLEEDTANLDHYFDTTTIDYNRAGVPLLELVTEPAFHSASEAVAFIEHIINIYRYTGISDADTKRGQVRCDVNVSIMDEDATEFGTKVEVKGVNSISGVFDTINYEIKRQTELKAQGKYNEVEQETRRWDEEKQITIRMRSKVDAIDYKYFVEPNIPKFKIDANWIEDLKKSIPRLHLERKYDYINNYGLSNYDAGVLVKDINIANYFEECLELNIDAKMAANWITTQILGYINKAEISINDLFFTPKRLADLINLINKGTISSKQAKDIFMKVIENKKEVMEFVSKDNAQISDSEELTKIIDSIIGNNPDNVEAYKNGKTNLFDFFVGQVMKETKGKANPVLTKEILNKKLN